MSYPEKLRERALEAVRNGYSKAEVSEMFGLGINTIKSWEDLEKETGSLENRPLNREARKIDRKELLEYYRQNPFSTNKKPQKHSMLVFLEYGVRRKLQT